ncbi:MAG: hypothetical protein WC473_02715 [Patescibacteria group bacterium]|jgi:hypothetical protein
MPEQNVEAGAVVKCYFCGTADKNGHHQDCPEYIDPDGGGKTLFWAKDRGKKIDDYSQGWVFGYKGIDRFYLRVKLRNPQFLLGYKNGSRDHKQSLSAVKN